MDNTKKSSVKLSDSDSLKILLEEYKIYVEMADRVSARRQQVNQFYIGILSGLLAILGFILEKNLLEESDKTLVFFLIAILGVILCFLWNINIKSYKQLNSGKFAVIHEMEASLPYPMYKREWDVLGQGKDQKKYRKLTLIESYISYVMCIPYIIILFYSISRMYLTF